MAINRLFSKFLIAALTAALLLVSSPSEGASQVSLYVKNELAIARTADYVTSGVPIPVSWNAVSTNLFSVLDAEGIQVPAQFLATARWGGTPANTAKPIKWVLVTFESNVPASASSNYTLVYGTANTTTSALQVTVNDENNLTIDTGLAQFVINKSKFSLFDAVTINGMTITQSNQNGFVLTDDQGNKYTSANDTPSSVTIEETGPVRTVVRVAGSLRQASGAALTDYTAHLYFYGGKSYVKVIYCIGNHNKAKVRDWGGYYVYDYYDPNSITFSELTNKIDLYQPGTLSYLFPGNNGNKTGTLSDLNIYQDSSGTSSWNRYASPENNPRLNSYVKFKGFEVTHGDNAMQLHAGDKFEGWLDISDNAKGVTVGIQSFWQNFPKGLSANSTGQISANLFPKDFGSLYNFRVGEEKSTEMYLFFHQGTGASANADVVAESLANPMMAIASPEWYIASKAIQEFTATTTSMENRLGQWNSTDAFTRYEYYNDRTLFADPTNTNVQYYYPFHSLWLSTSGHPSSTDYFDFYGWSWYGNQPLEQESYNDGQSGPFNLKYNFDYGAWLQFLRSGDYRWKGLAEASSKHLEALMLHDVITETGYDIYVWKDAIFGHEQHNELGNNNSVRNYLGPVGDTAYGARGAALHYFLTGYPASKRFVISAADYAYNHFGGTTYALYPSWAPSREAANAISFLDEGLRVTGDLKYANTILSLLNEYSTSKLAWINGPVPNSKVQLPTWIFGDYYTAIARYIKLCDEFGLTSNRTLAKNELLTYLTWHKTYATKAPDGWTSTYYLYNVNGNNDSNSDGMVNNWSLDLADAFAYGYAFSGDKTYLNTAADYYRTGVWNPFYPNSPLIYSSSKEAVNHMIYGHVYMYYVTATTVNTNDSKSDLVWRHSLSGANAVWFSADSTSFQWLTTVDDANWKIVGLGDFNGDSKSDLVWRHSLSGANAVWFSADSTSYQWLTTVEDANWKIVGVGDFNGDSKSDLVWRHSLSGQNVVWFSADSTSFQWLTTVDDANWKIVGVGDFNGDSKSDLAWRHSLSGANAVWFSADSTSYQWLTTVDDANWKIVGLGDFNGDSKSDLAWRHSLSGQNVVWFSADSTSFQWLATIDDANWKIVGVGD